MKNRREFITETVGVGVAAVGLPFVGSKAVEASPKVVKFRCEICTCDVPNKNNRIYPKSVMENAIKKFNSEPLYGMFQKGPATTAEVNLAEISHVVKDLKIEKSNNNDVLFGTIEFLDTPHGKIAKAMMDDDFNPAFRTNGIGSFKVDDEGRCIVKYDYKLVSISMSDAEYAA